MAGWAGKPLDVGASCGEAFCCWPCCWPPAVVRSVETVESPAKRLMRSARSASRLLVEGWWLWPRWVVPGRFCPRWPSLMAMVERAESEVVVLVGVPLDEDSG
jgi:hypothetical protein